MGLRVFVGYDPTEDDAYRVCVASLKRHAKVEVQPLKLDELRQAGLYTRQHVRENGQLLDHFTRQPFTTEFTFSRYLVPAVAGWKGWALFCDCDFLFRADVAELFALADPRYAVLVCQQRHAPAVGRKMEGQEQYAYWRKNWSSLMLWNCAHPAHARLVYRANSWQKDLLHELAWLDDELVGELPPCWNWIEGVTHGEAKAVHFTAGLPRMPGYEHCAYADEWRDELRGAR